MIFATLRQRSVQVLLALGLLLALPFVVNLQKAAATPLHHMAADMHTSCASYCAQIASYSPPQVVVTDRAEIQAPDPTPLPNNAYYVQFQASHTPLTIHPAGTFDTYVIRPPDIVGLTTNYRF